jgi:hypothetical protein
MEQLSAQQIALLEAPFALDEHAFVSNNPYIKKSAIRNRLNVVDSGWRSSPPQLVAVSGDVVVMSGSLTLCGVTRCAVGTGIIQRTKKDDNDKVIPLSDYEIARNTAKAFKTAESDLLPRCALQFGIGTYLKDMPPRTVRDTGTLKALLAKLNAPGGQPPVATPPQQRQQQPPPATHREAPPNGSRPAWHSTPAAQDAVKAQTGLTFDECKVLVPNLDAFVGVTAYATEVKKVLAKVASAATTPPWEVADGANSPLP